MTSLSEHLASQFYAWERRGRGWQVYGYPVVLEPAFRPFVGYLPLHAAGHDDGRTAGLAESLWSSVRGKVPASDQPAMLEFEEPEPERDTQDEEFVELQIRLPSAVDITPELSELLLLNLLASQQRIGFELLGVGPEIILQFVVPESHTGDLQAAIETYVPDIVVASRPTLRAAWETNVADETVVADFGLSNEFLLPLATPRSFRTDPLLGFLSTLDGLGEHEIGLVQVLFEPTRQPWGRTAVAWLTGTDGAPIFPDSKSLLAGAAEKFSRPVVAAVVRVAARAEDRERAWAVVRRLGGALAQFSGANDLMPLAAEGYDPFDQEQDLLRRRTHRGGILLSTAELAGLVHVPASSVRTEQVRASPAKTKAAPGSVASGEICLGENTHRGRSVRVLLPLPTRLRHTHIIGATGTGKSTLVKSLIRQDLEGGRGIGLLDPHGDLADEVLGLVPEDRLGEVVLFDPSDEEFPVGFNVLAAHSDRERNLLASDLTAIFRRFSTTWGDQMTAVMSSAVMALLECEGGGTLLDLRRFLGDREFREAKLASVHDPLLLSFWREEFPRLPGAKSQLPITTRLDAFLRPKSIRHMVAQNKSRLDLRRLMDTGGIFIAKLSQGAIGEENAHLLGSLLVAKLHQLAMSREQVPETQRTPFLLYLDEFQHFVTPSLTGLLTGARKYGVGLVLAHQELRQLSDAEVRGAVLANPATRVCFRLGDEDARLLASGFSSFEATDLVNLGVGDAVCRVGQSGHDFNLRVPEPAVADVQRSTARRDVVREGTRTRFGTPRTEVERMIAAFWSVALRTDPTRVAPERGPVATPVEPVAVELPQLAKHPPGLEPATPGRGGSQHKYLQGMVKQAGEAKGYRATIEATVGERGRADVLLERGDERIAVEISITTSADHEVGNLKKCLEAGVSRVAVLSPVPPVLQRIQEAALAALPEADFTRIVFTSAEEFVAALAEPAAPPTKTVRGYKVKTQVHVTDVAAAKERQDVLAQTIAGALRRLKRR
ncbi:MAG: hypothetical protein HMLKMBBP_01685 [Planctomycetes bacterium]|nr:hypothetical protein [Planctomycetota bacterium]